jgi:uncharacterized protein YdiU (UPF0061 family)
MDESSKRESDTMLWYEWMRKYVSAIKSQFDVSSDGVLRARSQEMKRANPKFVLRNWIVQRAIEKAEALDFSEVNKLLQYSRDPFDLNDTLVEEEYTRGPPKGSPRVCVSCSS